MSKPGYRIFLDMGHGDETEIAFTFANINGSKIYKVGRNSITTNISLHRKMKRLMPRDRYDDRGTEPVYTTAV